VAAAAGDLHLAAGAQLKLIEEMVDVLSGVELLASYRSADQHAGDRPSKSEQQGLRLCRRIVMDKLEQALRAEEELIGGTLAEEVNHFEGRLIARALEQENGSVTRAARALGVTHQGLSKILDGRQSTLAGTRRPKRNRRRSVMRRD
jgi:transcriptional regulator with GAF, ATPase, and Fis domain